MSFLREFAMIKFLFILFILININTFSKDIEQKENEEIFKKADEIMLKISKYGRRNPNLTVKKSFTSKNDVMKYLDSELKNQYKKNQFLAEEQALKLMGLIENNVNYENAIKSVLSQEVAGYYNPKNNTMYIADWLPINQQEIVLAHELFHAVQKQNYPAMEKMLNEDNSNPDRKLAISSILEGEATAIMLDYESVIKRKGKMSFDKIPALEFIINMSMLINPSQSFSKYSKYPQVMMGLMVFPYIRGLMFLKEFKKNGGWEAVDDIYKRLPISTEQILHIDKYLSNEKPLEIEFKNKDIFFENCIYLDSSIYGEAFFYTLFKNDNISKTNIEDSDGWNGDKIFVYKCKDYYSAILITEWDTKKDASGFLHSIGIFFKSSIQNSNLLKSNKMEFNIKTKLNKFYIGILNKKRVVVLLNVKNKNFNKIQLLH
jgi:hypothetical protein